MATRTPVHQPPALPRVRLAVYAVAALGALGLWLVAPRLLPEATSPAASSTNPAVTVNVSALDAVDRDLAAWGKLLADPRLEQLQPASQLQPGQPGNLSPFIREVAPAQ